MFSRPPPPPPTTCAAAPHHRVGTQAALHRRGREVGHQVHAALAGRAEYHGRVAQALAYRVGELEELPGVGHRHGLHHDLQAAELLRGRRKLVGHAAVRPLGRCLLELLHALAQLARARAGARPDRAAARCAP